MVGFFATLGIAGAFILLAQLIIQYTGERMSAPLAVKHLESDLDHLRERMQAATKHFQELQETLSAKH